MDYPVPKAKRIQEFLKSKGWQLLEKRKDFYLFAPPVEFQFKKDFKLRIPVLESADDYKRYIIPIVTSLADMYKVDRVLLIEYLSKSPAEIKKEIESQSKDIANMQELLSLAS